MRPDAPEGNQGPPVTGRCYCGATSLTADEWPRVLTYCHCSDCRRLTGAPVAAFAAFSDDALHIQPARPAVTPARPDVRRAFCSDCGSPLAAWFDYLPGQVYVPIGLLDQAPQLPPRMHSHIDARLSWLEINDDAERVAGTSRVGLVAAFEKR